MKRYFLPLVIFLFLVGVGWMIMWSTPMNNPNPAKPIRLSTGNWEPFIGKGLPGHGPVGQLVTEIFRRMGYEPEYTFSSWDMLLDETKEAHILGAFPFILTKDRSRDYEASRPLLTFRYVLFHRADEFTRKELVALRFSEFGNGLRFGKVSGYEVWPELAAVVDTFYSFPSSMEAFNALAEGKIDILPEGLLTGQYLLRGAELAVGIDDIVFIDPEVHSGFLSDETLHLLMPKGKDSQRFLAAFNEHLQEFKETWLYQDLLNQLNRSVENVSYIILRQADPELAGIPCTIPAKKNARLSLAYGTHGIVLDWPDAFESPDATTNDNDICMIKVLDGPQQGRIVMVDVRYVEIWEDDEGSFQ